MVIVGARTIYGSPQHIRAVRFSGTGANPFGVEDCNMPTPTPTLTNTPTPTPTFVTRVVATQAQEFHDHSAQFGLPVPFDLWPVVNNDRYENGYGPNGYAALYCQTPPLPTPTPGANPTPTPMPPDQCQYASTNRIHPGVDFFTDSYESNIRALCDGIIVPGKVPYNGTGGGGSAGTGAGVGLSLRCFANDPFDTDGNGLRNLSNIVVVYNHLTWLEDGVTAATPGGPYQIVRAGDIIAQTSGYTTRAGDYVRAHLDIQIYIANGYQVGAIQINPRLMFSEPLPREYIEQFPWPQGYDEWWLNGRLEGSTLKFWQNPNIDPPFLRDAAAYLNLTYPNGYDEPNCELPSNTTDYGLNGETKTCSIVSGENDINTPMPTPVQ